MKKTIGFLFLLLGLGAAAQKEKGTFATTIQAGLLEGETGSAFQLKSVNGFQLQTWTTGVGVGLDYYHTRSIPLFLALRKTASKSTRTPFFYADGGYHFPWQRQEDKTFNDVKATGGLYLDAGLGYQLPILKSSALFFSVGYSQKNFSEKSNAGVVIDIYPPVPVPTQTFTYNLRRLSIQTGIRF